MLGMVEEREYSLRNKVVDYTNFVYEMFSGLQTVLSIGRAVSQAWFLVLSLRLDSLVYSVFPGYFPSLGFPSKGSPVSLNSDTSSLAPNFIGKWCPFCGSVCAKFPFNMDTYLRGWVPDCSGRGGWDVSQSICRPHSRSINRIWRNNPGRNPLCCRFIDKTWLVTNVFWSLISKPELTHPDSVRYNP